MTNRKTQLAAAVGAALLASAGSTLAQQPLKVEVSGQVNRALMYADDGVQKKTFNVDNDISGTRFRFTGSAGMTPTIKAGVRLEWDYQSNESNLVNMGQASAPATSSATASPTLAERYLEVYFEHASFGRLHLGQGDGAANDGTEVDLSGTGIITSAFVSELGGGLSFRASGTGAAGPTITQAITQQDFESRYDRVLYVTPTFAGFRGQASTGTKDGASTSEASLWYAGKLGGFGDLAAAIGYSNQGGTPTTTPGVAHDETVGGSVSWLHTSGLNLTYSHSQRDIPLTTPLGATRDGKFDYFKVGYKFGQHAVGVDYAIGKDQSAVGDEVKTIGAGYVWSPTGWAELYAGYRAYSLDRPGTTFEDIAVLTIGTRLKF